MGRLSGDALARWVKASCARHGVPVKMSDPGTVRDVAVVLSGRAATSGGSRTFGPTGSDPPDDVDSVRVEAGTTNDGGGDDDAVDHSAHDGGLTVQGEIGPSSA